MVDKEQKEEIKKPFDKAQSVEKSVQEGEQAIHFRQEGEKVPERREMSPDDKIVSDELKKEIELMASDEKSSGEAEKKAELIEFLGEKEKIEHLLTMAREKGVLFAIQVARKMNEPYLLDILHDTLAQEGFYKKIGSSNDDDDDKKT